MGLFEEIMLDLMIFFASQL